MAGKDKLLSTYAKMLEKRRSVTEAYKAEVAKIDKARHVVATAMVDKDRYEEIPDIICEDAPEIAWTIGAQNDAYAIRLYRVIRNTVQSGNRAAKDFEALQNLHKEKIGGWLLNALNQSGAKSINCGESGKAYKRLKVRANPADWDAFLKWAAENEAADAIQKRVNASFVTKYEQEYDEPPPFLDIFKEYEVVVSK